MPAYVALGVGAVGLGVGAIFGGIALGKKSDLDSACTDKVCPASSQDTIDSSKTLATISTIGFIVGGVGIVTGVVLLLTGGKSSSSTSAATLAPEPTKLRIRIGASGFAGTF